MRDGIFLYGHYVSVQIKSMMQYKKSFMLAVMGQFLTSFNTFLGMFFMFQRFSAVGGFTYSQVVLCFGIFLMAFTLAECVARGFDTFSSIVRKGEFDRVMVRPRGLVLQVLGSRFELSRIGRMLQAVVMFIYGMRTSGICWDMPRVMTVVFMVAGGAVLFFGIFLAGAALCFFTLESLEIVNIFTYGAREFGTYPVGARSCIPAPGLPAAPGHVPGGGVRETYLAVLHLCCALRAGAVLSPFVFAWKAGGGLADVRPAVGGGVCGPLLWTVAGRGQKVSVGRVVNDPFPVTVQITLERLLFNRSTAGDVIKSA